MDYIPCMGDELSIHFRHGRGAVSKPPGRFEKISAGPEDDGWESLWRDEEEFSCKLKTNLHIDTSRTIINKIDSPDLPYRRSINPYRGCEHGCIYCYARPTHSFLGYSAGLDFETEIFYKPHAPEILSQELSAKNYDPLPITLGSNTDCYQPAERALKLTRKIIEVLQNNSHPFIIITKSALVVRDLDLLAPMAANNLVHVNISITTLNAELAGAMEPRASAPYRRLKTIEALASAGIPVTVLVAPIIPGLNDSEIENILSAAYEAGARGAHYTLVRLPYELKELFRDWLQIHQPERAQHVLSLIRQTRNGKLYDSAFGQRGRGSGAYADMLRQRFKLACKRLGFNCGDNSLRTDLFRPLEENACQLELWLD
jgi:DNA repair photolyase